LKHRSCLTAIGMVLGAFCVQLAWAAAPESQQATRKLAHDIFKQLIEINSTDSIGSTTVAAQAMAQRLLDAGFPVADVTVIGPNDRKGNMIARYRGRAGSKLRPILIIGHLDVVEARREDWTTDPFQFVEQDVPAMVSVASPSIVTIFARTARTSAWPSNPIIRPSSSITNF
jgi:hypothetical protein